MFHRIIDSRPILAAAFAALLCQAAIANDSSPQKSAATQKSDVAQKSCEMHWETVTETRTRTVYETLEEQREKVVYDTHYETQTVQDVQRVAETRYREEEFSYQVPVYETQTREVPYTTYVPTYETRSRDVNYVSYNLVPETRTRQIPFTTYQTVEENRVRTVPYTVPRQIEYTKTIDIHTGDWETHVEEQPGPIIEKCVREPGCWIWDPCRCCCVYQPGKTSMVQVQCPPIRTCKKVWVPRVEQRVMNCTRIEYETHTKEVPYTVTRVVPTVQTREESYTFFRRVPVTNTYTVHYQVCRMVPEQHAKTVTQVVTRSITKTSTRSVPYTVWNEVSVDRTITVPRTVPRTVTYTVTRCVPRQETYEVKVRVCRPVTKGAAQKDVNVKGSNVETDDVTPAAEPVSEDATSAGHQMVTLIRANDDATPLTGDARLAFSAGLDLFRHGNHRDAAEAFSRAAVLDSTNAKYAYFWAIAAKNSDEDELADRAATEAMRRERTQPVDDWGRVMERVQGTARVWVEQVRCHQGSDSHID